MDLAREEIEWLQLIDRLTTSRKADLGLRYFDIKLSTGDEYARWQPFQLDILNSTATFSSINKSRQIGASFILAGDALFDGIVRGNHTVIAVSYNLEEAKEKVIYAKKWWESRHPDPASVPARNEFDSNGTWQGKSPYRIDHFPDLVVDNALTLTWSNGFRFISHPCRPPRGKKASVLLDEFAHYMHDRPIYTAAFPMITRGYGNSCTIKLASTPLGANGQFWEVHTNQGDRYPKFDRHDFGWWEIENLCAPEYRIACLQEYLRSTPVERIVKRYGTERLHDLYSNTDFESFLQEYHLSFLDSAHAYLPWTLIRGAYPQFWRSLDPENEDDEFDFENMSPEEYDQRYLCAVATAYTNSDNTPNIDDALVKIRMIADAVKSGQISGTLMFTYDCGRDRDAAEINVWEAKEGRANQRMIITMRQLKFEAQREVIRAVYRMLPITRGLVDKGAVGREISEWIEEKYGSERGQGVWYDTGKKELWIKSLKLGLERRTVTLIPNRDQEQQLHDVERHVTASKNFVYRLRSRTTSTGTGQKVEHHGDKVWTAAQGAYLCSVFMGASGMVGTGLPKEPHLSADGAVKQVVNKGSFGDRIGHARAAATLINNRMRRG